LADTMLFRHERDAPSGIHAAIQRGSAVHQSTDQQLHRMNPTDSVHETQPYIILFVIILHAVHTPFGTVRNAARQSG
jgi:hypothetical protein